MLCEFQTLKPLASQQQGSAPPAIGNPSGATSPPGLDLNQLLNLLPMSGQKGQRPQISTPESTEKPIRLLRFLKPSAAAGKVTIPRLQAPTLSGDYSDQLFTDKAISVVNDTESQPTGVGKVRIGELHNSDIPIFDDDPGQTQQK